MSAQQDYLELLDELGGILDRLTEIAHKKVDSTRQGDLMALNECMKQEQVCTLSLKTLERRRLGLLSDMQMEAVPLSQLSEHYPAELKARAREAAESVRDKYQIYESASTAARTVMERALRDIEKMLPEGQAPEPGAAPQARTDFRA